MKKINYQVIETFDNGTSNVLGKFTTEKEARNFFDEQLKEDAYKPMDEKSDVLELNKVILDEDGDIYDDKTIDSQTLYEEGTIDRNNYKGENAIYYGYESIWNAKERELEYTFYFQGEKEDGTVLESELNNWFFK